MNTILASFSSSKAQLHSKIAISCFARSNYLLQQDSTYFKPRSKYLKHRCLQKVQYIKSTVISSQLLPIEMSRGPCHRVPPQWQATKESPAAMVCGGDISLVLPTGQRALRHLWALLPLKLTLGCVNRREKQQVNLQRLFKIHLIAFVRVIYKI